MGAETGMESIVAPINKRCTGALLPVIIRNDIEFIVCKATTAICTTTATTPRRTNTTIMKPTATNTTTTATPTRTTLRKE
jgi:hypothetical protein